MAWALLVLAAWQGWLGPAAGRGAEFCEATRAGLIKQPINAVSNLGFTLAALAIAAKVSRTETGSRTALVSFAAVVALLSDRGAPRCTPPRPPSVAISSC